jgi:hypothetical protein
MTLTEQPSTRMVVFQNVVFKNDNGCDNDNGTISVGLPIKAQRVQRQSVLVRLSKRLSNLSHTTVPIENFPPQQTKIVSPPLERQNSSESDLSFSKLDITDEYSGIGGNESLNTSRQASEIDLTGRKSSFPTSQRFVESFRNFYSRFSQKHPTNLSNTNTINNASSSTIDSSTRLTQHSLASSRKSIFDYNLFSCCFSTPRNESPLDVATPHRRSFLFL